VSITTESIVSLYHVAGRLLQVRSENEEVDRRVRKYISGLHINPAEVSPQIESQVCLDCYAPGPKGKPFGQERFAVPHGECFVTGDSYLIDIEGWQVSFGAEDPRKVVLTFGESGYGNDRWNRLTAISYAIQAVLRRGELFDLHAAALACSETNIGVLIVGPSGSGKSSLSVRLAGSGWKYLSDDIVIAYADGPQVFVSGLRRPMTVTPSSISSALPGMPSGMFEPLPEDPDKVRVDPSECFPGLYADRTAPSLIMFSHVTDSPRTSVRQLTQTESMTRLLKLCPWATYDPLSSRPFISVLTSLVRQTRSFDLFAGRDIYNDSEYTSRLISSYLNR
jgi:hypothetical protein